LPTYVSACPAGRLRQGQVDGLSAMLDGWQARVRAAIRGKLAYVLATAFHETAATMQSVRETLATTDETEIRRLDAAFAAGRAEKREDAVLATGCTG